MENVGHTGSAIRALREAQGLSLRQVAEMSGTNATYISQVERGIRVPSDRWMDAVKRALAAHLGGAA